MKKRVLLLFIGIISFLSVWSQNDSLQSKSIFVGVRNNKYASIGFQAKNWSVGLENTIFIRHLNEQYIRANGAFQSVFADKNRHTGTGHVVFVGNGCNVFSQQLRFKPFL